MEGTCICRIHLPDSFVEIANGIRVCGWCKRFFDATGKDVERPAVIDHEPIDLTHLDNLTIGKSGSQCRVCGIPTPFGYNTCKDCSKKARRAKKVKRLLKYLKKKRGTK